ncbi:endolytic transglycosylase MltG [Streptomyces sp. NBC_00820]|uniref:endolytic transglycosylase MltG n=1 Tax=Streptomyces sp. NBC_00820 TaxID=2975842 RepID=UPI002ED5A5C7|nr:endolytic transglycosylase MltG [Streptomyces sp. NBC_00820]
MTEYGRGPGSEPWHPEDPLYGDGGWGGQQAHPGQQAPYDGQSQQQYPQQPQHGEWTHEQQQSGYGQQPYPYADQQGHAQYDQQGQPYAGQQAQPQYDQQGQPQYDQQGQPQYDQQGHAQYDQQGQPYADPQYAGHAQQQYGQQPQAQSQHQGGWDATGTHGHVPYAADPGDPYGQQPVAYGAEQPDLYGTEDAYPPPVPPGRRTPEPSPGPDPETGWDPGEDEGEQAFFADGDDGDDDSDDESESRSGRGERRTKGRKPVKGKKQRTGCACMVVVLVFGGGLAGVSYFGYQFYKNRVAPAPDFAGKGNGELVQVEIPKGAVGYDIGRKLKEQGVVESVDAFISAQQANPNGKTLQDGVYTLQKHMSAASAVELMLSPKSRDNLIIPEGRRNVWVYEEIDRRLQVSKGTTAAVAKKDWKDLGLPSWANNKDISDPLEGFLFPSSYPVAKGMKPKAVLKSMVARADEQYKQYDLAGKAEELGLDGPQQLLTLASLVQVEGKYKHDFDKVARVVYNRLKPDNQETAGRLEFDSTINYLRGQSTLDVGTVSDLRKIHNPYNTYYVKGLPPGPISNPGAEAIESALKPAPGPWYYFVSINENETAFAVTLEEHNRNVAKYELARKQAGH